MPLDDVRQVMRWDQHDVGLLSDEFLPDIRARAESGQSSRQIGQHYGVSHVTVQKFLRKHGIARSQGRPAGIHLAHTETRQKRALATIREHPGIDAWQLLKLAYGRGDMIHTVRQDMQTLLGRGLISNVGKGRYLAKQSEPSRAALMTTS